ncbi:unnamed protein product [Ceutorhynchus assimilis]|uniref:Exoribonuclease phosphorolytic domain-containing protein n=1 Tax=Ceutorhynchus assimilis TaxID=467358 RepID=A0A9N9MLA1_9CUCU|nr:unnamed protein product [Ceutorhynchus assimilis]
MPLDHKRLNGPEESVPYELFLRHKQETVEIKTLDEVTKDSDISREHPKIYLKTGTVSQAKGSAYIEIGETKIIVTVFDPKEIPNKQDYSLKGEISCEFKYAPFSCTKRRLHQQDNEEKRNSLIMKKALESAVCLHEIPNFQVAIHSLVLQNDGSALSGAIIAAGVALAEAGVPMFDIITSMTLEICRSNEIDSLRKMTGQIQVAGEKSHYGTIIISKLHANEQICQVHQTGFIPGDQLKNYITVLSKSCDSIAAIVKKCLLKEVVNHIK